MNLPHRTVPHRLLVAAAVTLATGALAQEAITSPTTKVLAPLLRNAAPKSDSSPAAPSGAFFQYGNLSFHPALQARWAYADGLPSGNGRTISSVISTYTTALRVDAGEHWALDYTPTWTIYDAKEMNDSVDHAVRLSGAGTVLDDWDVQVAETYGRTNTILFETGKQTKQTNSNTQLQFGRTFFSKFGFQSVNTVADRTGDGVPGTRNYTTMNSALVAFSKKFQAGAALGLGYNALAAQPDTTSVNYLVRSNWIPTDKLRLTIDGGIETLRSRASRATKTLHNPVVNASVGWQPFEVTTITLANTQSTQNSFFIDQVTESSNWSLSWQQRLLGHFFLSAAYTYAESDFESLGGVANPSNLVPDSTLVSPPGRSDRVHGFNLALTTQLFQRLDITLGYQRNANSSSQRGFTATSSQVSLALGARY